MKTPILVLTILASAAIGATVVYMILGHKTETALIPAPVTASTPADTTPAAPERAVTPPVQPASAPAGTPPPAAPAIAASAPADPANSEAAIALRKTVDALLDPHITAAKKHELFQQLAKSGQLPDAIAELKQRALDNPNDPEIPTTLGEAQLNQLRVLKDAGAEVNDLGILAMQADQSFNAALKLDPANYEAQLVKSISMTYWPADPTRDAQVVQTLSGLIDQQENMPQDPGFAQTYFYLGNEYQKIGQIEKANATWQLGLQKFPNNMDLQNKLSGH